MKRENVGSFADLSCHNSFTASFLIRLKTTPAYHGLRHEVPPKAALNKTNPRFDEFLIEVKIIQFKQLY